MFLLGSVWTAVELHGLLLAIGGVTFPQLIGPGIMPPNITKSAPAPNALAISLAS